MRYKQRTKIMLKLSWDDKIFYGQILNVHICLVHSIFDDSTTQTHKEDAEGMMNMKT